MLKTFFENPRLILFGLLATFFSGAGQSFLVSFFAPGMQESFSLSHGAFGSLYSLSTLGGAFALPFLGRALDRSELLKFTLVMAFCLAIGCLTLSLANHVVFLVLGLLLIRLFGQGTMSLVSSTTIARQFGSRRGKALGITLQGYPLSEAILPLVISAWILNYGWRSGWTFLAVVILIVFMPACIYLLTHPSVESARRPKKASTLLKNQKKITWPAKKVLKDYRFYVAILNSIAAPAVLTSVFIYQYLISEQKSWDTQVMAQAFVAFAVGRSALSFFMGPIIDRLGARRVLGFVLLPLALGILCLMFGENSIWAFLALGLAGIAVGSGHNAKAAFWAEAYGTENLGSIRGITSLAVVISTAATPILFGVAFDLGMTIRHLLGIAFLMVCVGSIAGFFCSILYRPKV